MNILNKEDYEEPACLLDMDRSEERPLYAVPVSRVVEKLDEYLSHDDWAGAGRHLMYWLAEAKAGRDRRGELAVRNEMMGYYRKSGKEAEARESMQEALRLLADLGMTGNIIAGTTWVNAATVCKTFGHADEALPYFELARALYERELPENDGRLGGLYNNMAAGFFFRPNHLRKMFHIHTKGSADGRTPLLLSLAGIIDHGGKGRVSAEDGKPSPERLLCLCLPDLCSRL